jgi:hypothetical protein
MSDIKIKLTDKITASPEALRDLYISLIKNYEQLKQERDSYKKVVKECDDYLSPNKLNSICTGSILHKMMKTALNNHKQGDDNE